MNAYLPILNIYNELLGQIMANLAKVSHIINGFLRGRYLRYSIGYFWLFMHYLRLRFPGASINKLIFTHLIKPKLKGTESTQVILDVTLTSEVPRFSLDSRGFFDKRVALGLPFTARRSGVVMEGEMMFAYRTSWMQYGNSPLLIDTSRDVKDMEFERKHIFRELREHQIQILVIYGDSLLSDADIFNESLILQIRNSGIAVVVDLVDCLVTRGGQRWVDYFSERADFLVCHNSRLRLNGKFAENSLVWPSLPYPERYYLRMHTTKIIDCLIPGNEHRGRPHYVQYAASKGLYLENKLYSSTNTTSTRFTYQEYANALCQAKIIFTNGYRNRHESQVIGRVTEAMLARATLLYETGSDIDSFFEPYTDYIPIYNLPDFYEKTQFLIQNPGIAEKIATGGLNSVIAKYPTRDFWGRIISKLS